MIYAKTSEESGRTLGNWEDFCQWRERCQFQPLVELWVEGVCVYRDGALVPA